jgi:conjugative transfer signal peptidase TraF
MCLWSRFVLILVGAAVTWLSVGEVLCFNFTTSLPLGLYRRVGRRISKGDIVMACLPPTAARLAIARGYVWPGDCPGRAAPIGKLVVAVAGDTVTLTREEVRVNGAALPNSRLANFDSKGRALEHYPFASHVLTGDEVWLFSPYHALSFDSRYFGPVHRRNIRSRIIPLWIKATSANEARVPSRKK